MILHGHCSNSNYTSVTISGVEEDDFEYGGRSTRSEVESVTLSDNHTPTIILLENFVYESLCQGVYFKFVYVIT